jgi:hypothetical protein
MNAVKKVLREVNIKKLRAQKRTLLTEDYACTRLTFALALRDWIKDDWEGVIFSDESSVQISKDTYTDWVFRKSHDKYYKNCIYGVIKGPRVKFMVLSCI